jgi:molecular chaperone GrpE
MAQERTEQQQSPEQPTDNPQEPIAQPGPAKELTIEEQLRLTLAKAEKAAESFKDQLLRKAAEFENYKRRSEADYINIIKSANEGLIASLIPILDDFARSLKSGKGMKDFDAFYRGIELIHNKLSKILAAQGLATFESSGKPFDVDYHDALLQVPRSDVPPHTVIEEVERGYKLNDKVLRHAKVIVSSSEDTQQEPAAIPRNEKPDEGDQA